MQSKIITMAAMRSKTWHLRERASKRAGDKRKKIKIKIKSNQIGKRERAIEKTKT